MKIETYKCDRCGKTAQTEDEKKELGLGEIHIGFKIYGGYRYVSASVFAANQIWSRDWCRTCRKELGILENEIKEPEVQDNAPSLEDMVREIVHREMSQGQ